MKVAEEARLALAEGFASIAAQFKLPSAFPAEVQAAADAAAVAKTSDGKPAWAEGRRDATGLALVTLDPATSTDLDQAFVLDQDGDEIVLSYALADVGAFVPRGGVIETEAWQRGVTVYGPAEKVSLYPKVISQGAASLLPDGPRPAVLVIVGIRPDGTVRLRSVECVVCESRAKLAYDSIDMSSIPHLSEFAKRMWTDEITRGATRVDFPQQEVVSDPGAPGGVRLELHPRLESEIVNSALSLAVNLALAALMKEAGVGLFRVMADPDERALAPLRRAARALNLGWLASENLRDLQRRLDPTNAQHQRFLLDARRVGGRAGYGVYDPQTPPWHSAIAASYAHATAPMRRLADRYVLDLSVLLAGGSAIPPEMKTQLEALPDVMQRNEARAASVDRAVIDLLEAVSLQNRVGEIFEAEVVDARGEVVQIVDPAVRARVANLPRLQDGEKVRVRIDSADIAARKVHLTAV
jgi:exoribonuclease R